VAPDLDIAEDIDERSMDGDGLNLSSRPALDQTSERDIERAAHPATLRCMAMLHLPRLHSCKGMGKTKKKSNERSPKTCVDLKGSGGASHAAPLKYR
jgi:hypothetical protein